MWEEEEQVQPNDTSKMIDVTFRIDCKTYHIIMLAL
jgi:hypothetical protein